MKNTASLLLLLLLSMAYTAQAQLEFGGSPVGYDLRSAAPLQLPAPNLARHFAEDAVNDGQGGTPFRFAANIDTDIDTERQGLWSELPDGGRVWHLHLTSPGALTLNFHFDTYLLPEGARLFVYSPDGTSVKGAYTRDNASPFGTFAIGILNGDEAVIEYQEPPGAQVEHALHLNQVSHGYRHIPGLTTPEAHREAKGPFGNSGQCNVNVNCPEGMPWQAQSRSVALMIINGNRLCSGALVNNVAQDGTPFFLTANHCLVNTSVNQNWVLYFNHESPTCVGSDGPTNQSLSGAQLRAWSQESDFALGVLNTPPPPSFNVCFSGLNVTDTDGLMGRVVGIHHPSGDVKKIAIDEDGPYKRNMGIFVNQVWFIDHWEVGVTEGGSSGSPLFDIMGNSTGVLSGGAAACIGANNNRQHDYYGRLGIAWDFFPNHQHQLKAWLDPENTGALIIPNSCVTPAEVDLVLVGIDSLATVSCDTLTVEPVLQLVNTGSEVIQSFTYSREVNFGMGIEILEWTGSLSPFETANVILDAFTPQDGRNELRIEVLSINGMPVQSNAGKRMESIFFAFASNEELSLEINLDNFPNETTWTVTAGGAVLYRGGPYSTPATTVVEQFCMGTRVCFEMNIFDSAGDGLCCGFGDGSYRLLSPNGEVLASGAQFGSVSSTQICRGPELTSPLLINDIMLYPNPSSGDVQMILRGARRSLGFVRIFDVSGRLIKEDSRLRGLPSDWPYALPTTHLTEGIYVIQVEVGEDVLSSKLVIGR